MLHLGIGEIAEWGFRIDASNYFSQTDQHLQFGTADLFVYENARPIDNPEVISAILMRRSKQIVAGTSGRKEHRLTRVQEAPGEDLLRQRVCSQGMDPGKIGKLPFTLSL